MEKELAQSDLPSKRKLPNTISALQVERVTRETEGNSLTALVTSPDGELQVILMMVVVETWLALMKTTITIISLTIIGIIINRCEQ